MCSVRSFYLHLRLVDFFLTFDGKFRGFIVHIFLLSSHLTNYFLCLRDWFWWREVWGSDFGSVLWEGCGVSGTEPSDLILLISRPVEINNWNYYDYSDQQSAGYLKHTVSASRAREETIEPPGKLVFYCNEHNHLICRLTMMTSVISIDCNK